jgi:hypothetical protein
MELILFTETADGYFHMVSPTTYIAVFYTEFCFIKFLG